jgi:hypothetical protein
VALDLSSRFPGSTYSGRTSRSRLHGGGDHLIEHFTVRLDGTSDEPSGDSVLLDVFDFADQPKLGAVIYARPLARQSGGSLFQGGTGDSWLETDEVLVGVEACGGACVEVGVDFSVDGHGYLYVGGGPGIREAAASNVTFSPERSHDESEWEGACEIVAVAGLNAEAFASVSGKEGGFAGGGDIGEGAGRSVMPSGSTRLR